MSECRRGFVPTDEKEFNTESVTLLRRAQKDILYLLEQGYKINPASTFVGNHFRLSERQRLAIVRATAVKEVLELREKKRITRLGASKQVFLDGFNVIITLEVALSNSTLIHCMDKTIRDLAGLRGTYRIIDKTEEAIRLIGEELENLGCEEAVFYLDAPVSNSGRLKQKLQEELNPFPFQTRVELVDNADVILQRLDNVVTQDAIILNQCDGWINLTAQIITARLSKLPLVELG